MFRRWLKRRAAEAAVTIQPWEGSDGYYVAAFRRQLEEIAQKLSESGWRRVKASFSREFGCAELHDADKGVIARIKVNGSECAPYEAIIRTRLPDSAKTLFSKLIPLHVSFEGMDSW